MVKYAESTAATIARCVLRDILSTHSTRRTAFARIVRAPARFVSSRRRHTCTRATREATRGNRAACGSANIARCGAPASRSTALNSSRTVRPLRAVRPLGVPYHCSAQHQPAKSWLGFLVTQQWSFAVTRRILAGAAPPAMRALPAAHHAGRQHLSRTLKARSS